MSKRKHSFEKLKLIARSEIETEDILEDCNLVINSFPFLGLILYPFTKRLISLNLQRAFLKGIIYAEEQKSSRQEKRA